MKKVTTISWEKFMFDQLPKRAQKTGLAYIKYRIARMEDALKEIKNRKEFASFEDFVFGRLTEAKEILAVIKRIERTNK